MEHSPPCPAASTPLRQSVGRKKVRRARTVPGQGLVEYGLLLVFIAIVVVGAVTLIGTKTSTMYVKVDCSMDHTQPHCSP